MAKALEMSMFERIGNQQETSNQDLNDHHSWSHSHLSEMADSKGEGLLCPLQVPVVVSTARPTGNFWGWIQKTAFGQDDRRTSGAHSWE